MKYPIPKLTFSHRKDGIDYYRLVEDYCVTIADHEICVKEGSVTDGASIPWFVWSFGNVPLDSRILPAAVIHDDFCEKAKKAKVWEMRNIGDAYFRYILRDIGEITYFRAVVMYWLVWLQGLFTLRFTRVRKWLARQTQKRVP